MAIIKVRVTEIYSAEFIYEIEVADGSDLDEALEQASEEHDRLSRKEVVDLLQYVDTTIEQAD